ncbi:MAG TPA: HypC/HybG/HupF family hydrogenase formation chaperone [Thermoleophilia bacterium]|nr:HypC/HybG/HupF family hydrogenase formation chaperone [Thermoleophilia bacterium]
MCLAIPARIVSIDGIMGIIDLEGVRREVSLILCPEAVVGEYALVHAGFAISVIDEEQARLGLEAFDEFRRLLEEGAA